jgi:hypothetical protein
MQLTLTHSDITKALCVYLQAQGMTAFDPNVVTAEFAFKRGTKELTCVLDSEAKPLVEAGVSDPKPSAVTQTATTSASVAEAQATAPVAVAEEPAHVAPVVEPVTTTAELETAGGGDDDNLFD